MAKFIRSSVVLVVLLLAGCGQLEVGIETPPPPAPSLTPTQAETLLSITSHTL